MTTKTRKVRGKRTISNGSAKKSLIPREPVEPSGNLTDYCVFIFGAKGVGKTSLAAQFPGSVILQLEPRRRSLRVRQYEVRPMSIKELTRKGITDSPWTKIKEFIAEAIKDDTVDHICIDTADKFYDAAFIHHCTKKGVENPSECNDWGQTWDAIRWDVEEQVNKILYSDLGCLLTSHTKLRENEEDMEGTEFYAPTCKPAMWQILKAAADYSFFYGFLSSKRVLRMRGSEERYWLACGPEDHFLSPEGNRVETISMGVTSTEAYQQLTNSFKNKVQDISSPSPTKTMKKIRRGD